MEITPWPLPKKRTYFCISVFQYTIIVYRSLDFNNFMWSKISMTSRKVKFIRPWKLLTQSSLKKKAHHLKMLTLKFIFSKDSPRWLHWTMYFIYFKIRLVNGPQRDTLLNTMHVYKLIWIPTRFFSENSNSEEIVSERSKFKNTKLCSAIRLLVLLYTDIDHTGTFMKD